MNEGLKGDKKMSTLGYDGASVIMRHDMFRANHDIVTRFDNFAIWKAN